MKIILQLTFVFMQLIWLPIVSVQTFRYTALKKIKGVEQCRKLLR